MPPASWKAASPIAAGELFNYRDLSPDVSHRSIMHDRSVNIAPAVVESTLCPSTRRVCQAKHLMPLPRRREMLSKFCAKFNQRSSVKIGRLIERRLVFLRRSSLPLGVGYKKRLLIDVTRRQTNSHLPSYFPLEVNDSGDKRDRMQSARRGKAGVGGGEENRAR